MRRNTERRLTLQDWIPCIFLYDCLRKGATGLDAEYNERFGHYFREPNFPFSTWVSWQVCTAGIAMAYPIIAAMEYLAR